jgi:hypothetical protein
METNGFQFKKTQRIKKKEKQETRAKALVVSGNNKSKKN